MRRASAALVILLVMAGVGVGSFYFVRHSIEKNHASNDTATQPASNGPPVTGSYMNTDASNLFITVSQVTSLGTEQTEVDVTVRNQSGSLISVGEPLLGTAAGGIMTLWPPSGGATTASYSTNRASVSFNPADRQSWISWPGGTPSTCVFNLEDGG